MLLLVPLLLLIHFVLLINTRFTLWPEMVVYPYLVNNGFMLYRDIINPYPPFLSYSLAIFAKIFGYQPLPYQILTRFLLNLQLIFHLYFLLFYPSLLGSMGFGLILCRHPSFFYLFIFFINL